MAEILLSIFSFLLLIIILWFTYTIVNIVVTIFRCKKLDKSLKFCFNTTGKIFYGLLTILYIVGYSASSLVMIGRKNMMVGRMMIDYRKLKKVNFTYNNKMSFVYAQKDYSQFDLKN